MSAAPKRHTWISLWFLFCYLVVLWDLVYILIRPASLPGGRFRWMWSIYGELEDFDKTYDLTYFYEGHVKSMNLSAKGVLSIAEVLFAMIYLIQVHVVPSPVAPLFGFTAALATTLKGVLWVFEEFYCGWCTIGHNAPLQIFISWTLPTALWTVLPAISAWQLGSDIAESLRDLAETRVSMPTSKSNGRKAETEKAAVTL